jgi:hypothetical protein
LVILKEFRTDGLLSLVRAEIGGDLEAQYVVLFGEGATGLNAERIRVLEHPSGAKLRNRARLA